MGIIISRRAALKGTAASLAASLSVGWPLARRRGRDRDARALGFRRSGAAAGFQVAGLCQSRRAQGRPAGIARHRRSGQPEFRYLRHAQHFFPEGRRRGGHAGDLRYADGRQRRRARLGLRPARPLRALYPGQADLSFPAASRGAVFRRLAAARRRRRLFADDAEGKGAPVFFPVVDRRSRAWRPRPTTSSRCASSRTARATRISSSPACRSSRPPGGRDGISTRRRSKRRSVPEPTRSRRLSRAASSNSNSTTIIGRRTIRSMWAAANFQRLRYEYFRERQVAFEAFKAGVVNFNEEHTSRFWATSYDFAAVKEGRVVKESLHNGAPTGSQGWYFNTRREQFKDPRVREAIGLAFDFEWTNKNVMFSSYKRVVSFFQNTPLQAVGPPGPDELRAAGAAARQTSRFGVRRALYAADLRRVGQRPGAAEARQRNAARGGLPARRRRSEAAERQALHDRVSRFLSRRCSRIRCRSSRIWRSSASPRVSRIVDASQYKSRTEAFDFDVMSFRLIRESDAGTRLAPVVFLRRRRRSTDRATWRASSIPPSMRSSRRSRRRSRARS